MASFDFDAIVVGARCAGSPTAMLLARQGHRVTLVDRARFPSDTLSTHAIARAGVVQLDRWGLLDDVLATGAPPVRTASFHVGGEVIELRIKARAGIDHLVAPRRHVLDPLLLDAAAAAGADVRTGLNVTGVTRHLGRVTGIAGRDEGGDDVTINARFVVGADGLRSRIAYGPACALARSKTATTAGGAGTGRRCASSTKQSTTRPVASTGAPGPSSARRTV